MVKRSNKKLLKKRSYKRKAYGGTKKRTKKPSKSRKRKPSKTRTKKPSHSKKNTVVKTRSTNPWLLYSGPRAESMYHGRIVQEPSSDSVREAFFPIDRVTKNEIMSRVSNN